MIPRYNKKEFSQAKSRQLLPIQCSWCGKIFLKPKNYIQAYIKGKAHITIDYCSPECKNQTQEEKVKGICTSCHTPFERIKSQITRSKNLFCSLSCSTYYNNTHKIRGTRRSKLEAWIEEQLKILYPHLEILFNQKNAIGSELDIFIPSLKLAFELNGIFHFEPIFSEEKLQRIQEMDKQKFKLCHQNNISLCVIDTSKQKYFKEASSKIFLKIITDIISNHLPSKST